MTSSDKVRPQPRPTIFSCPFTSAPVRGLTFLLALSVSQENLQPASPSVLQRAKNMMKSSPSKDVALPPQRLWHEQGKGYEIMERILKPLVGVFNDVMQELHDSRVPDVGREEEDAFMSKAVQYIRQYILSDRVTMRYLTEKEALTGLVTALCDGTLDPPGVVGQGRKRSFVTSLILSTSPFIAVLEKSLTTLELLLVGYDHRSFDTDDALCHNVARVLTSLIESKNAPTGIFGCANSNRAAVAEKFFNSMNCDAMLFIYLEMIGASEDKRIDDLQAYCRDFHIMDSLLEMLATSKENAVTKNLLEAIVTVSSCFADKSGVLSSLISKRAISAVVNSAVTSTNSPSGTVCRLAALTHLAILETSCVTVCVAEQLPQVQALLKNNPKAYCEKRKHDMYETPVGSVRIAVIELLVAFIDKCRDPVVEPTMPCLIEQVMLFFFNHTMNDFIGIEMVQLVRRVLASNIPSRIQQGMLTMASLQGLQSAIHQISNIWQLGHLRCIVSDILAKYEDDAAVHHHLEQYSEWGVLLQSMRDMKDAKVINARHKRRRGTGDHVDGDCDLPVSPLSVLAAGELHKTLGANGAIVHEDTPRKVMYVTQQQAPTSVRVPTPTGGHSASVVFGASASASSSEPEPAEDETVKALF
eukprot:COSAG05_NODE_1540_length_4597_cov_383.329257_2_plen_642_part_00